MPGWAGCTATRRWSASVSSERKVGSPDSNREGSFEYDGAAHHSLRVTVDRRHFLSAAASTLFTRQQQKQKKGERVNRTQSAKTAQPAQTSSEPCEHLW